MPNEENSAFGQLKQGSLCLQADGEGSEIKLVECSESEPSHNSWAFSINSASIQHGKLCLTYHQGAKHPVLEACSQSHQQASTDFGSFNTWEPLGGGGLIKSTCCK